MRDDMKFNIHFCQTVESYPCLYDSNRMDYCNRSAVDEAWKEIAELIGAEVEECKERWKNLRGRYTKYKQQSEHAGPRAKKVKRYYLADNLQFLDVFLKLRKRKFKDTEEERGHIEVGDSEEENQQDGFDEELDIKPDCSLLQVNNPNSNESPSLDLPLPSEFLEQTTQQSKDSWSGKSKKVPTGSMSEEISSACKRFEVTLRNLLEQQQSNAALQADPDMAFLQSVLPDMKKMSDGQKRNFKLGILRLAGEILND